MKKVKSLTSLFSLIGVFTLSLTGCSSIDATCYGEPGERKEIDYSLRNESSSYQNIKDSLYVFGARFADITSPIDQTTNTAVSPLTLYMALSLVARSSEGNTRNEILNALGVSYEDLLDGFYILYNTLNFVEESSKGKTIGELSLTNTIWVDQSLKVKEECIKSLSDDFYCYSYGVDFKNDPKKASKEFSKFIKEQTNGVINKNFEYTQDTLFILLSTLYLKDVWNDLGDDLPFYSNQKSTFTLGNGQTTETRLLVGEYFSGRTYSTDKYETFYTSTENNIEIQFIIPKDNVSLESISTREVYEEALNVSYEYSNSELLERYHTRIAFPEFEASYDADVKDLVRDEFNIYDLFSAATCDLSAITTQSGYVGKIDHVNELKVTKKGIEGASVSIVEIWEGSGATEGDSYKDVYETLVIDRAFNYIVSYYEIPLFMGSINSL